MRTNSFRPKFVLPIVPAVLAICLWILAGSAAFAQSADGDLQAAVSSAITHDPMLKNQPVTASTAGGVVTLTGTVETDQQRQEAETVAANVQGVSGIQNNITVSGQSAQNTPPAPGDAQQPPLRRPPTISSPQPLREQSKFLPLPHLTSQPSPLPVRLTRPREPTARPLIRAAMAATPLRSRTAGR